MAPTVKNDDQWVGTLSATPDRICKDDALTVKVEFTNPDFEARSREEQKWIYNNCFSCHYSCSSNEVLDNYLRAALTFKNPLTTPSFPDIPDGAYDIDVEITTKGAKEPLPAKLALRPASVSDSATISVISRLFETDSRVTLQRTFAGPTSDRALWPAIRNRTAAIGFADTRSLSIASSARTPQLRSTLFGLKS